MLNFGWAEMMVIGVVALIVIGPEDLPDMFRQLGRFTAKLRSMSREFSRAMEQAAKETGVKDVAKDLKAVTTPKALGIDAVKSAADKFEKWDPIKNAAKPAMKPLVPPSMPATPLSSKSAPIRVDDLVEAADDLAEHAALVRGPATQALYDKKAAREAVLREQAEKLRAIEDGSWQPEPVAAPVKVAKPAWKAPPKKVGDSVAVPESVAAVPVTKPRAPRKTKKADEA